MGCHQTLERSCDRSLRNETMVITNTRKNTTRPTNARAEIIERVVVLAAIEVLDLRLELTLRPVTWEASVIIACCSA